VKTCTVIKYGAKECSDFQLKFQPVWCYLWYKYHNPLLQGS
jgi:hypothetical protein